LRVRLREPGHRSESQRLLSDALGVSVQLESDPTALSARAPDPERVALALSELSRSDIGIAEFSLGQPSLDEVFFALTGRPAVPVATEESATEAPTTAEEDAA
jgi:ABC-2 type transport system ATP-binding protein